MGTPDIGYKNTHTCTQTHTETQMALGFRATPRSFNEPAGRVRCSRRQKREEEKNAEMNDTHTHAQTPPFKTRGGAGKDNVRAGA
jgi:hypothetical protein